MEKTLRIRNLQAKINTSAAGSAGRHGRVSEGYSTHDSHGAIPVRSSITNAHARTRTYTREGKGSRLDQLRAGLAQQQQSTKFQPGRKKPPEAAEVTWPRRGWPQAKTYRVGELISWWRFQWTKFFPKTDLPHFYNSMRTRLLGWLRESGHKRAEAVIEFACSNWKMLRARFERLFEVEGPALQVIFFYRNAFEREMNKAAQASTKRNKWAAAQWKNTSDEDYAEEVLDRY